MSWIQYLAYCFPPFCLIFRVLQKIVQEVAAVAIFPKWPSQTWWSPMARLLNCHPLLLPTSKTLIYLPNYLPNNASTRHPMSPRLQLFVCILSGDPFRIKGFQQKLPTFSSVLGEKKPLSNTGLTSKSGQHTVVNGRLIRYKQL